MMADWTEKHVRKNVYTELDQWVNNWLLNTIRKQPNPTLLWCADWWKHPEAVSRLAGLWAAWENSHQLAGNEPSNWWIHHYQTQWPELTSTTGPFKSCTPQKHEPDPNKLPTTKPKYVNNTTN